MTNHTDQAPDRSWPEIACSSETDMVALAAQLAEVSANLAAYVEARAVEVAEPRIRAAQEESAAVDAGCAAELAATRQRFWDVVGELRRTIDVRTRNAERYRGRADTAEAEVKRLRALLLEVLAEFKRRGHPGEPCLQTGWVRVTRVQAWRAGVRPTPETP